MSASTRLHRKKLLAADKARADLELKELANAETVKLKSETTKSVEKKRREEIIVNIRRMSAKDVEQAEEYLKDYRGRKKRQGGD